MSRKKSNSDSNTDGDEPFLNTKRYTLIKKLGQGGYGEVWLGKDRSGEDVAIKIAETWKKNVADVNAAEVESLERVKDCQFVVEMIDHGPPRDIPTSYIVLKYYNGGTLYDYINDVMWKSPSISSKEQKRNEDVTLQVMCEISEALECLHHQDSKTKPLVHSDVKPENILIEKNGGKGHHLQNGGKITFHLADFGLAGTFSGLPSFFKIPGVKKKIVGSPEYLSPEMTPSPARDVWALGVTLYLMMYGKYPFESDGGGMKQLFKNIRETEPLFEPHPLEDIVRAMLSKDPRERPTAGEIHDECVRQRY